MRNYIVSSLVTTFLFFTLGLGYSHAAYLKFEPSTATVNVGETVQVGIVIDTTADKILGVDAVFQYDSNVLEIEGINDGTFMKVARKEFSTPGKGYVATVVEDPGTDKEGTGTLATVVFKAKADGATDVSFICDIGETNESNISKSDLDATDIITCSQNGKSAITVGSGAQAPTSPPGGGGDSPSKLPNSGIVEDTIFMLSIIGVALVFVGVGVKIILLKI